MVSAAEASLLVCVGRSIQRQGSGFTQLSAADKRSREQSGGVSTVVGVKSLGGRKGTVRMCLYVNVSMCKCERSDFLALKTET